jgi:hypothetical protein
MSTGWKLSFCVTAIIDPFATGRWRLVPLVVNQAEPGQLYYRSAFVCLTSIQVVKDEK